MSITIENAEAEALLTEMAARTHRAAPELLLDLLRRERERLDHDGARKRAEALESARLLRESWNARPLLDSAPIDEILAYDENGLPV